MIKAVFSFPEGEVLSRPAAARVVHMAEHFESRVMVQYGEKLANAKSMLGLMSLCAACRGQMDLLCDGPDQDSAMAAVLPLLTGCGEA